MLNKISLFLISPDLSFRREIFLILPVILLLSLMTTCQEPGPAPNPFRNTTLALEIPDASCTEAWLRVSLTGDDTLSTALPVVVKRDAATVMELLLSPPDYDTLMVDQGLEPSHPYSYKAYRRNLAGTALVDSSDSATVTTMDTTSHDFTWTIDTLGDYGSYLKDVAIIDENNIWAVGDIQTDSGRYNLAKWNGVSWNLHLFGVPGVTGDGIYAFSENDVWVATGIIYHWNNGTWERYHLWDMGVLGPNDGGVTSVWGSSPEDVWFVGSRGSIVHYDGSGFTRLESGTDVRLTDIWGKDNQNIWAVGEESGYSKSIVLYFNGHTWEQVYHNDWSGEQNCDNLCGNMRTVWVQQNYIYMGGSAGIWDKEISTQTWNLTRDININPTGMFERKIRGKNINDILIVGNDMMGFHFNGLSWKEVIYNAPYADLMSVAMTRNLSVAVGFTTESKALVVKGYR